MTKIYIHRFRNSAFSLIELLVVIAIVAILSSVAVPVYKDYMIRSKVASTFGILDRIATEAMIYINNKGAQTTGVAELGYPGTTYNMDLSQANLDQYYARFTINAVTCNDNEYSVVGGRLDPDFLGINSGTSSLWIAVAIYEDGGVLHSVCGLHEHNTNTFSTTDMSEYAPENCKQRFGTNWGCGLDGNPSVLTPEG